MNTLNKCFLQVGKQIKGQLEIPKVISEREDKKFFLHKLAILSILIYPESIVMRIFFLGLHSEDYAQD